MRERDINMSGTVSQTQLDSENAESGVVCETATPDEKLTTETRQGSQAVENDSMSDQYDEVGHGASQENNGYA